MCALAFTAHLYQCNTNLLPLQLTCSWLCNPLWVQGSISAVVECLLYLRDHINSEPGEDGIHDVGKPGSQLRKRWRLPEGDWAAAFGNHIQRGQNSMVLGEGDRRFAESKSQHVWESPVISGIIMVVVIRSYIFLNVF